MNIALVGTGLIATQKHLPAWRRMGDRATVVALCDVDRARGQAVAEQFDVPTVYPDVQTMMQIARPDIVDICTPPRTHASIAIAALEAGAHVLIEKPMAIDTAECDAIIRMSEKVNRQVCVAHSDLFYPSFMRLRRAVARGAVGEFRGMHIFLSTPVDYMTSVQDHWANKLPGGVFGESGPHVVYMTLAFINPICDVQVHASKLLSEYPWSPYEDYRLNLIGSNATSSVTLAYTSTHWAAQIEVWGSKGIIRADLESQNVVRSMRTKLTPVWIGFSMASTLVQTASNLIGTSAQFVGRRFQPTHDLLIREFYESIVAGEPPPVTAQEGREAVRVMNQIVRDIQTSSDLPVPGQ